MKNLRIALIIVAVAVTGLFLYVFVTDRYTKDRTIPQIVMEDEILEVSVSADNEALKAGVTAKDEKDGDLTDQIIVESVSKFVEKNTAEVTYAVCDSDNHVAKATRKVRYTDHKPPHFMLSQSLVYSPSSRINLLDVLSAEDDIDGDITTKMVITTDETDTSGVGTYTITLQVTNSKGENAILTLPVFIENLSVSSPSVQLSEYLTYVKVGRRLTAQEFIVPGQNLNITVDTNLDTSKPGVYQIHYYCTDRNNQAGHTVLNVVVEE